MYFFLLFSLSEHLTVCCSIPNSCYKGITSISFRMSVQSNHLFTQISNQFYTSNPPYSENTPHILDVLKHGLMIIIINFHLIFYFSFFFYSSCILCSTAACIHPKICKKKKSLFSKIQTHVESIGFNLQGVETLQKRKSNL